MFNKVPVNCELFKALIQFLMDLLLFKFSHVDAENKLSTVAFKGNKRLADVLVDELVEVLVVDVINAVIQRSNDVAMN